VAGARAETLGFAGSVTRFGQVPIMVAIRRGARGHERGSSSAGCCCTASQSPASIEPRCGVVIQYVLFPWKKVQGNIEFGLRVQHIPPLNASDVWSASSSR
jgi:hypothetical protein